MFSQRYFDTFCFSWLLVSPQSKVVDRGVGLLFALPPEATSPECEDYYLRAPAGWSLCPAGYAVYCRIIPSLYNFRLVLPGLKVSGLSRKTGKTPGLTIRAEAESIEEYVAKMFESFLRIEEYLRNVLNRSVHEVRSINTDIKNASEDVIYRLGAKNLDLIACTERVKNIRALSEILSSRTDFLDYFANPEIAQLGATAIRVYQKFDKTIQSLTPRALERGIRIERRGNSFGEINGLRVFEVIPYLVVENAIKHSPDGHAVTVEFLERPADITVTIENLGPRLKNGETERVFEAGFRGENAIAAGTPGFGIGLFFLRDLVERLHSGKIRFSQSPMGVQLGKLEYCRTRMELTFARTS